MHLVGQRNKRVSLLFQLHHYYENQLACDHLSVSLCLPLGNYRFFAAEFGLLDFKANSWIDFGRMHN